MTFLAGQRITTQVVNKACAQISTETAQTIADNTSTEIEFDQVDFDNENMADLVNNSIVLSRSGFWMLSFTMEWDGSDLGRRDAAILVNGLGVIWGTRQISTGSSIDSRQPEAGLYGPLSAGDVITLLARQTTGASLDTVAGNRGPRLSVAFQQPT